MVVEKVTSVPSRYPATTVSWYVCPAVTEGRKRGVPIVAVCPLVSHHQELSRGHLHPDVVVVAVRELQPDVGKRHEVPLVVPSCGSSACVWSLCRPPQTRRWRRSPAAPSGAESKWRCSRSCTPRPTGRGRPEAPSSSPQDVPIYGIEGVLLTAVVIGGRLLALFWLRTNP